LQLNHAKENLGLNYNIKARQFEFPALHCFEDQYKSFKILEQSGKAWKLGVKRFTGKMLKSGEKVEILFYSKDWLFGKSDRQETNQIAESLKYSLQVQNFLEKSAMSFPNIGIFEKSLSLEL